MKIFFILAVFLLSASLSHAQTREKEERPLELKSTEKVTVSSVNKKMYLNDTEVRINPADAVMKIQQKTEMKPSQIEIYSKSQPAGEKVPTYRATTQRQARLFGLFNVKVEEKVEVNALDGSVSEVKTPWWSWLSF